jgi:hypothetical protein
MTPNCHTNSTLVGDTQASEDRYNNKGAYIVLEAPDFSVPHFFEFEAVHPRPKVLNMNLEVHDTLHRDNFSLQGVRQMYYVFVLLPFTVCVFCS